MLVRLCNIIARDIASASSRRELLQVGNPTFRPDKFTDRWPESIDQQNEWRRKVIDLAEAIEMLKRTDVSLETISAALRNLFGGIVVSRGLKRFNERLGHAVQTGQHRYTDRGGLYVPSKPAIITGAMGGVTPGTAARAHTFMGGRLA